ncbi:type I CRISPR-associated protein Cas7 [Gallicola sp. Sow4_E12]|uniref:type I CRISPR-associated protein Cas7 n=1 Tax=Gallicola sp. Sow4_E12 TaxID=3438785 RepID=UPI003F9145F6
MDKRVYGVLGIRSIMANWNADFSGRPKSISTGEIFGSDKALKYPIKRYFMENGEKVLYTKTYKSVETKTGTELGVRSLKERYEDLFDVEDLGKDTDQMTVLKNLFSAADVKNFGATFAEAKNNISITGAVQIGQGFNKYEDSYVESQQILSPFRNPTKKKDSDEERGQSTLGIKIISNEAHYVYPFVINPNNYRDYIDMGATEGYTEEDYSKLKDAMIIAATFYSTNAKMGCDNELAVFIETEKDLYLPDLSQFVKFDKEEDINVFYLEFDTILEPVKDRIKSIEIYYNSYDSKVICNLENIKKYNIFSKEEI